MRVPQRSFQDQFHSLTAAANVEGVSFYTIDASGLNPLDGFGAEDRYRARIQGFGGRHE